MTDQEQGSHGESSKAPAAPGKGATQTIVYNDSISRWFVGASVIWGIVGMLVGVLIALQMAWWHANIPPFLTFGRLRPLHTNAVIFAFVGNMMFAGVYYSTQRLVKARLPSDMLAKAHFWLWQAIIVSAAVTLPLGITQGKEYAELEWPIDLAITVTWVIFAVNFFWTLAVRREKHLYVALWFYIATIVTVAVLHIVNSMAIPVSLFKSYSIYGGTKDALVQWWYGHNAVAFFLTTPILGIMYYYLPKAANRPVYSYRLSIIHFWALIFLYIWAGPHHLLNSALPDWAQTLGMIFSVMLWAPSWGGMINGLLTLRGAWGQVRTDPVLKFLAAGVTFYGMSTFEGPLLSIKAVNGLAHYTDWIIAHVHGGALGWNGLMAAGMFYWMVPRLWGRELWSKRWAEAHFWMSTVGILIYIGSMWASGVTQGLMWRAEDAQGALVYPNFVETINAIRLLYWMRILGGAAYLVGMVMMAINLGKTALAGSPVDGTVEVPVAPAKEPGPSWLSLLFGKPILVFVVAFALAAAAALSGFIAGAAFAVVALAVGILGVLAINAAGGGEKAWHRLLEGRAFVFTALALLAILIGGTAEIIPTLLIQPVESASARPYRALELEGRDIYIREGCYNCHSQMIRPFKAEQLRYGDPSTMADSQYDHPFQWGSKRTGPDLARVGPKYPNVWHYQHLVDPRQVSPGSNMPPYAWLAGAELDYSQTAAKMRAQRSVGVPYEAQDIDKATDDAKAEAREIAANLHSAGVDTAPDTQIVALIAYLRRLGATPTSSGPARVTMVP